MVRFLLTSAVCLSLLMPLSAQLSGGLLLGISSVSIKPKTFIYKDELGKDAVSFGFKKANYGYHFGGFLRYQAKSFFIQPEVVFNSNTTTFTYKVLQAPFNSDSLLTERYQRLDIPVLLGIKVGILRIGAGPVAHIFINNKSELRNIKGYDDKFKSATFGYQIGIGFDIQRISFDLRHEGNFTHFGDHIIIDNHTFDFDKGESRLMATLGFKF